MNTAFDRRAVLCAAAGLLGSTALPTLAWAADPRSTRLRIGLTAPNTTLDPHLQSNAPNNAVATHIFEALVTSDERSRWVPGLATAWTVLDDTHWRFDLRRGVSFTDGSPFTAADAIGSLQRATHLPSTASFRPCTRSIKAMSAPDPLHHEATVWGARQEISDVTRADQYTLATGIGITA